MDKRSKAQLAFDYAKHGWAFCNADMLEGKIIRCEDIAMELDADDKRHDTLKQMQQALKGMTNG
jgi:hypothetical protein